MPLAQEHFDFIEEFLADIIRGDAALFVGAGLSVPAGYVDWRELLRPLAKELGLDIDLESDLIAVAQFHVTYSGDNRHKLHARLLDSLKEDARSTRNHELLVQLPIKTFWTTNYDKLIEDTLRGVHKVADVKSSVPQLATSLVNRDVTLYKMHGDIDYPDKAIVTKDDYDKYGREYEPFVMALAGDLVTKTFLFLGFSFTDPNLEHVLSRVRQNFKKDARQHHAIFRSRQRLPGESDGAWKHHQARQKLVIDDLKRFNIRVLLIDDYADITEILESLVSQYLRRTIFVATGAADPARWDQGAVTDFAQALAGRLIADGARIATGLEGAIGDEVFKGALRAIMQHKLRIEDTLILRPLPLRDEDSKKSADKWDKYRKEIIPHAGIALFLFGNEKQACRTDLDDSMEKEFEIAQAQGLAVLPIGATGGMASVLAEKSLSEPAQFLHALDAGGQTMLKSIAFGGTPANLMSLIDPIGQLVRKLQGKTGEFVRKKIRVERWASR